MIGMGFVSSGAILTYNDKVKGSATTAILWITGAIGVVVSFDRINSVYYSWKMALYILALLLIGLVAVSIVMHYGLVVLDLLPWAASGQSPAERNLFAPNYGFILNILFLVVSVFLVWLWRRGKSETDEHDDSDSPSLKDWLFRGLTIMAFIWFGRWFAHAPSFDLKIEEQ